MKVRTRVRRIGNSLGIIIPRDGAAEAGLREGDSVEVEVSRRAELKELFGTAKLTVGAQQLKDEARDGWGE